jgi:hypothetical protein
MAKVKRSGAGPVVLLDAAERKVVDASQGRALAAATQAQLGTLIAQARSLRDKWRDQFRSQRRTTQRTAAARGVGGNDRSHEKSELFADVLGRFEARLAEIGGTVAAAVKAAAKQSGPTKAARTQGHRITRASVRATLAELVTAKPGGKKVGRAAAVKAARAADGAAVKKAVPAAAVKTDVAPVKAPVVATTASKKRLIGPPETVAAAKAGGKNKKRVLAADPAKQLRAATKLKASRVRLAGLDTRIRGNAKAAGRRQQGRRDGRTR